MSDPTLRCSICGVPVWSTIGGKCTACYESTIPHDYVMIHISDSRETVRQCARCNLVRIVHTPPHLVWFYSRGAHLDEEPGCTRGDMTEERAAEEAERGTR